MIGRVKSSSTFLIIATPQTKTIFNGNICLGRTMLCIKTRAMYCPVRLKKNALRPLRTKIKRSQKSNKHCGTLVCYHCDRKWGYVSVVFWISWDTSDTDHCRSCRRLITDRRPFLIFQYVLSASLQYLRFSALF